jgi:hypothetical protein
MNRIYVKFVGVAGIVFLTSIVTVMFVLGVITGRKMAMPTDYGFAPAANAFTNDLANLGVDVSDPDHAVAVKAVVCSEVKIGWDEDRIVSSVQDYLGTDNATANDVRDLIRDYYNC